MLGQGTKHALDIVFDSALLTRKKLEKEQGFKNLFWNGDSSRMNVRKIGCHFGWDWAPTLLNCGPWRDIWLETSNGRVADVNIDVDVADGLQSATVSIEYAIEGKGEVRVELVDPQSQVIHQQGGIGDVKVARPQYGGQFVKATNHSTPSRRY